MSDQSYVPPPFRAPETPNVSVPPLPSPTVAAPTFTETPSAASPSTKKKSNRPLVIILGVVVLAMLGAGVWAYVTFVALSSPKEVMAKMIEAFGSVDTFAFDGSAILKIPELERRIDEGDPLLLTPKEKEGGSLSPFMGTGTFSFAFSGAVDATDETNVDGFAQINVSAEAFSLGLEVRNVDKNAYVKVDTLPPFFAMLGSVETLSDQWVRLNADEMLGGPGLGEFKKKLDEKITEAQEGAYTSTKEQNKQVLAAFLGAEVLKMTQTLKAEKFGDTPSYHYAFVLDPVALEAFLIRAHEIVPEAPLERKNMEVLLKRFDDVDVQGEIWIGKKDFLPRKLTMTLLPKEENGVTVTFNVLLDAYNEPVVIEEPEGSRPITEVIRGIMEATRKDTDEDGAQDTEEEQDGTDPNNPDTDADGLLDWEEDRYLTDPLNPDTDGDGYLDGAEVTNGYDPNGEGKIGLRTDE
jgi:hypothetical protein